MLITGETVTGKEVVAQAIHNASDRARFPLVCVNCSALPEALLEAELFGPVKGAFTGATNARMGRFEQAWTKSATCRSACKRRSYVSFKSANSSAWAARKPSTWTCA